MTDFQDNPYPDAPRILFVGLSESSHTHAWIDLLDDAGFNVRLFALPGGSPPDDWPTRTYLTAPDRPVPDSDTRLTLPDARSPHFWLAEVIRTWQPQIVHTLGIEPAGLFYHQTRQAFGVAGVGKWILQLRGGSDIVLHTMNPELAPQIERALDEADQILVDNDVAMEFVRRRGIGPEKMSSWNPIPGTGGVDVTALSQWKTRPSDRRIILWPKAYNSPWSQAFPVLEAFQLCWEQIQPCEVYMLASSLDVQMRFNLLPPEMRQAFHIDDRIPRSEVIHLMSRTRVLLAPSLVDGFPTVAIEAMSSGVLPILSPLATITPVVKAEQNVLFARNLYPQEIADALVRAMTDDALVERVARTNVERVREFGDRRQLRPRVVDYYSGLTAEVDASPSVALTIDEPADSGAQWSPLQSADVAVLSLEYDALVQKWDRLRQDQTVLRQQFADVTQRLDALERHYSDLQAEYTRSNDDLIAVQAHLSALQGEYGAAQAHQLTLQAHYEALQQEYARSQADLVLAQQNLTSFQHEYAVVHEQLLALMADMAAQTDSLPADDDQG